MTHSMTHTSDDVIKLTDTSASRELIEFFLILLNCSFDDLEAGVFVAVESFPPF